MKKLLFSTVAFTGLLAASLQAGQEVYKQVAPPPPPMYGLGFYGGIDMGANIYQNRGGDRTFTQDNPTLPGFGDSLTVDPKNDVGFFGGIKLGYVFGTGSVFISNLTNNKTGVNFSATTAPTPIRSTKSKLHCSCMTFSP